MLGLGNDAAARRPAFEGAILGAATTEITLGDFDGGGNANNCLIQRVTSYDGVNGAIP